MAGPRDTLKAAAGAWIRRNWETSGDAVTMVVYARQLGIDPQLIEALRRPFVEVALSEAEAALKRVRLRMPRVAIWAVDAVRAWLARGAPADVMERRPLMDRAEQVQHSVQARAAMDMVTTAMLAADTATRAAGDPALGGYAKWALTAAYYRAETEALGRGVTQYATRGELASAHHEEVNAALATVERQVIPWPRPLRETGTTVAHGDGWVIYSQTFGRRAALSDPLYAQYNVQVTPRGDWDGWLGGATLLDAVDFVGHEGRDQMIDAGRQMGLLPEKP